MKRILSVLFLLCIIIIIDSTIVYAQNDVEVKPNVVYETHVQDVGWQGQRKDGERAGTEGKSLRLEGIKIKLKNTPDTMKIKYSTHIQDIGWQEWKQNGEMSGTEGKSLRLEAIKIKLEETEEYSIMYRVHIQDIGWQSWKYDGEIAGTEGLSKRLEAIEIKLVDKRAKVKMYLDEGKDGTIYYKNDEIKIRGWKMADVSNTKILAYLDGERIDDSKITYSQRDDVITNVVGYGNSKQNPTPQYSFDIEKDKLTEGKHTIKIETIDLKEKVIGKIETNIIYDITERIEYRSHVEDIGWQNWRKNGGLSGTEGQSKRVEALKLKLVNFPQNVKVKYQVHIQDIGWQNWKYDGEIAGTEGKSLRIEAIKIKLENTEEYTVEYRVHVQNIGWTGWYIDGETAGTSGKSLRIEAIQIKIVPKYKRQYMGIDVSYVQENIDYDKMVESKEVDFIIARAGWYSESRKQFVIDKQFERNYKEAKSRKIPLGTYIYSYAVDKDEAKREAEGLINYLKETNQTNFELPIFYDVEDSTQAGLDKNTITQIIITFCETVKEAGFMVGVYTNVDWYTNRIDISQVPTDYGLWIAHYESNNDGSLPDNLNKYSKTHDIWQYTSSGTVPGINVKVDKNICYKKYF